MVHPSITAHPIISQTQAATQEFFDQLEESARSSLMTFCEQNVLEPQIIDDVIRILKQRERRIDTFNSSLVSCANFLSAAPNSEAAFKRMVEDTIVEGLRVFNINAEKNPANFYHLSPHIKEFIRDIDRLLRRIFFPESLRTVKATKAGDIPLLDIPQQDDFPRDGDITQKKRWLLIQLARISAAWHDATRLNGAPHDEKESARLACQDLNEKLCELMVAHPISSTPWSCLPCFWNTPAEHPLQAFRNHLDFVMDEMVFVGTYLAKPNLPMSVVVAEFAKYSSTPKVQASMQDLLATQASIELCDVHRTTLSFVNEDIQEQWSDMQGFVDYHPSLKPLLELINGILEDASDMDQLPIAMAKLSQNCKMFPELARKFGIAPLSESEFTQFLVWVKQIKRMLTAARTCQETAFSSPIDSTDVKFATIFDKWKAGLAHEITFAEGLHPQAIIAILAEGSELRDRLSENVDVDGWQRHARFLNALRDSKGLNALDSKSAAMLLFANACHQPGLYDTQYEDPSAVSTPYRQSNVIPADLALADSHEQLPGSTQPAAAGAMTVVAAFVTPVPH